MKVAIHHREGSFSQEWIMYCEHSQIDYKIVNAYDSDIVEQLRGYDVFLWHHHHGKFRDTLFAKQLLISLDTASKIVYPDYRTTWHFDDKIGQKYLLESVEAPVVPSYVFYSREKALLWARETSYPKVFKLRGGAGATNVRLVKSFGESKQIINQAFSRGFSAFNRRAMLRDSFRVFKKDRDFGVLIKTLFRMVFLTEDFKMSSRQKGYVYFQDFIPNNDCDIRLIVIGGRYVYGMRRMNRENDFRASGSSVFDYDNIPLDAVGLALKTAQLLKLQSGAFDIIYSQGKPLIIEVSYGFGTAGSSKCPGYWDENLVWHSSRVEPMKWLIQSLMKNFEH